MRPLRSRLSPREDGRRGNELRRLECDLDVVSGADGSCAFEMGRTKVVAAVYVLPLARARAAIPRLEVELNLAGPSFGDWDPHEETDWFSESE